MPNIRVPGPRQPQSNPTRGRDWKVVHVYDTQTSVGLVVAWSLWAWVIILSAAALALAAVGYWRGAFLLGLMAGVLAPAAAVAHIRWYVTRLAEITRRLHGIDARGVDGTGR